MKRVRWLRRGCVVVLMTVACGVGDADEERYEPPTSDLRNEQVVENGELSEAPWRIGAAPLFSVGWADGDPDFMWLHSGRILDDGGALVGDAGVGSLFRIASDGSVVAQWGQQGEGPGEFQGLDAILTDGDSILVSDGRQLRVTVLSSDGEVIDTHRMRGSGLYKISSVLPDQRLLLVPGEGYGPVSEIRPEWVFESLPIIAMEMGGEVADTLVELPHLRRWYGTRGARSGPVVVKGRAAGFGEGFVWARSDEPQVHWYDSEGQLERVARWREEPVQLTSATRDAFKDILRTTLVTAGADEGTVSRRLAELDEGFDLHEGPIPYWRSFHVDRLGNAWLSEYTFTGQFPDRWRVVRRDGVLVGWVDLPDVVAILDITDDRVLAVRFDEFDTPAIVMFGLLKE
ncbi:MAG: hypothetical protein HKN72_08395 [Gemmatimonadetes bacterium]|nr:hypothetical protein [Gemmatimonadota bacterium]